MLLNEFMSVIFCISFNLCDGFLILVFDLVIFSVALFSFCKNLFGLLVDKIGFIDLSFINSIEDILFIELSL